MVYLFAAMTSFALLALGIGLIAGALRSSGRAILSAMAGEMRFAPLQHQPRVRRRVRFRTQLVPATPLRAAA